MSEHGAYGDEMGRFFRMSDRDLDRLCSVLAAAETGARFLAAVDITYRSVTFCH